MVVAKPQLVNILYLSGSSLILPLLTLEFLIVALPMGKGA